MKKIQKLFLLFLSLTLSFSALTVKAQEAEIIKSFNSEVLVQKDGALIVTETIIVNAEHDQINHGIYRDFPTNYKDDDNNNYNTTFEVLDIQQDGKAQLYHTERESNGTRVYIGDPDKLVATGEHTYQIKYKTTRQLGYFDDYDQLYWNVTGNGWVFPILKAETTITLPEGIAQDKLTKTAYTGPEGSTAQDYTSEVRLTANKQIQLFFATTKELGSYEGFTIKTTWPKGYITYPTKAQLRAYFIQDNFGGIVYLFGAAILFIYFFLVWKKYGRDPKSFPIIPQYESPKDLSPFLVRYVYKKTVDDEAFTALLINMAQKGFITIKEDKDGYTFTKIKEAKEAGAESIILNNLFKGTKTFSLTKKERSNPELMAASSALKSYVYEKYNDIYFYENTGLKVLGILLFILVSVAAFLGSYFISNTDVFVAIFLVMGAGFFSLFFFAFIKIVKETFDNYKILRSASYLFRLAVIGIMVIIFGLIILACLLVIIYESSLLFSIGFSVSLFITLIFTFLLSAYTNEGAEILAQIKGLKWFLSVTEKDRMNFHNPPDLTPKLFEKFLAFALALEVGQKWAEQFKNIIAERQFQPDWYSGVSAAHFSASSFSNSLSSSFSSTISSASTAPSSSSGGGGSGGGGGGGGGGGW